MNVIYAIGMVVIYAWINHYDKKHSKLSNGTESNYRIITPPILKKVCMLMFATGIVLYVFFLILYLKKEGGATKGHIVFALAFALIGVIFYFFACKWKIEISEDKMRISPLFKRAITIDIAEIEKAKLGNKGELAIYYRGKKITTVDALCINFDKLYDILFKYNKL